MRILITGATGYVGNALLEALLKKKYCIAVISRSKNSILDGDAQEYKVIYTSDKKWKDKVKMFDPTVVINLAAYITSNDNEDSIEKLIDSNIKFGTHLLDSLKDTSVEVFINTGTFAEYSNNDGLLVPAYLYAATKSAFRNILNYYQNVINFKVINVIPYTIYGGIDTKKKLIDLIYDSLDSPNTINMSPGEQKLDFIHLDDVISFYLQLIPRLPVLNLKNKEFHLGTGIGTTPKQIAFLFQKLTGKTANINWGGIPYRPKDTMCSIAPLDGLKKTMNWIPSINIERGISLYIKTVQNKNGI